MPEIGPNDVLIKVQKTAICGTDVHIYNWDAVGAEDRAGADGHRPRIRRRRSPTSAPAVTELQGRPARLGRRPHRLRPCRNCRAGRGHLCRNTLGVGVNRPGAFAEYRRDPAAQRRADPRRRPRRDRRDLRSARQCRPHRAVLRSGRRGRAGHRRRADRHHGRAGRQARRRAQGRHHRHQPRPAGARAEARRRARGRCLARKTCATSCRRSA